MGVGQGVSLVQWRETWLDGDIWGWGALLSAVWETWMRSRERGEDEKERNLYRA